MSTNSRNFLVTLHYPQNQMRSMVESKHNPYTFTVCIIDFRHVCISANSIRKPKPNDICVQRNYSYVTTNS